jgi:hypothetical protein
VIISFQHKNSAGFWKATTKIEKSFSFIAPVNAAEGWVIFSGYTKWNNVSSCGNVE